MRSMLKTGRRERPSTDAECPRWHATQRKSNTSCQQRFFRKKKTRAVTVRTQPQSAKPHQNMPHILASWTRHLNRRLTRPPPHLPRTRCRCAARHPSGQVLFSGCASEDPGAVSRPGTTRFGGRCSGTGLAGTKSKSTLGAVVRVKTKHRRKQTRSLLAEPHSQTTRAALSLLYTHHRHECGHTLAYRG